MKKHIAVLVAAALLGAPVGALAGEFATRVNACGLAECQPCGGLTSKRECNKTVTPTVTATKTATPKAPPTPTSTPTATKTPTAPPQPPRGGGVPTPEEDAPPTPTASPTASPTPSVGLVPPVSTTVPPVQPTWVVPKALPKAGG